MPRGVTATPYVPLKTLPLLSMAVVGDPGTSFRIQKPLGLLPSTWLMNPTPAGWLLTVTEFTVIPAPRFTVVMPCTQLVNWPAMATFRPRDGQKDSL